MEMPKDPITVSEAAAIHGKNPSTIRRWILSGRLKGYPQNGRLKFVSLAEVKKLKAPPRGRRWPAK